MTTIAFIGLGHMGLPMARNLLKAGFALRVFDLLQSAVDSLAAEGATPAASAAEAVTGAQVVVSMLPASRHVEGLYLGESGLMAQISPGSLVLECSTIARSRRARSTLPPARAASPCSMRRSPVAPPARRPAP